MEDEEEAEDEIENSIIDVLGAGDRDGLDGQRLGRSDTDAVDADTATGYPDPGDRDTTDTNTADGDTVDVDTDPGDVDTATDHSDPGDLDPDTAPGRDTDAG